MEIPTMVRILVVEDTQDSFDLLEDALDGVHELVHARDGRRALELARMAQPELILMDMGLPGMDGWAVVRRLKSDAELADIPIIALTAHAMTGDRERCLSAGCSDYLAKPVDIQELMARVEAWTADGQRLEGASRAS